MIPLRILFLAAWGAFRKRDDEIHHANLLWNCFTSLSVCLFLLNPWLHDEQEEEEEDGLFGGMEEHPPDQDGNHASSSFLHIIVSLIHLFHGSFPQQTEDDSIRIIYLKTSLFSDVNWIREFMKWMEKKKRDEERENQHSGWMEA